MKKIKINNASIQEIVTEKATEFPKYSTQLMNLANQNAQGTRPRIVGQMSDLIHEYPGKTVAEWRDWYLSEKPEALETATSKVFEMVQNFQDVISQINRNMVKDWLYDLVVTKTYIGMNFQEFILKYLSTRRNQDYRFSTPEEESKGIDGYVGELAISIKPITYKSKLTLPETITVEMVYYEKKKDGVWIYSDII